MVERIENRRVPTEASTNIPIFFFPMGNREYLFHRTSIYKIELLYITYRKFQKVEDFSTSHPILPPFVDASLENQRKRRKKKNIYIQKNKIKNGMPHRLDNNDNNNWHTRKKEIFKSINLSFYQFKGWRISNSQARTICGYIWFDLEWKRPSLFPPGQSIISVYACVCVQFNQHRRPVVCTRYVYKLNISSRNSTKKEEEKAKLPKTRNVGTARASSSDRSSMSWNNIKVIFRFFCPREDLLLLV